MAIIRLEPHAAEAVAANLKAANLAFEAPACECFDGHDSQSKMMEEFEDRVRDVLGLVDRYQSLLENDVRALQQVCNAIVLGDKAMAMLHKLGDLAGAKSAGKAGNGSADFGGR